jgi:hypothetical protein
VTFTDLRVVMPNASTACGSAGLLAQLDRTLTAFDGISASRYALADQAAFYAWLQLDDPDAPAPEPSEPVEPEADEGEAAVHLEAGWTLLEDFDWPVRPGCCGVQTTGPVPPDGPIPTDGWPADGFYDVDADRLAESPDELQLTLRRWVACDERPDLGCGDIPDGHTTDTRIVGDPASEVVERIPIEELGAILVPIHGPIGNVWPEPSTAALGEPGALSRLLVDGIDPAFRRWVHEPFLAGEEASAIWRELVERSVDPDFPFGLDFCADAEDCTGPVAYRGPHGTSLRANPAGVIAVGLDHWPPGRYGLYGWSDVTLELRDGVPILYLWAGQVAG